MVSIPFAFLSMAFRQLLNLSWAMMLTPLLNFIAIIGTLTALVIISGRMLDLRRKAYEHADDDEEDGV